MYWFYNVVKLIFVGISVFMKLLLFVSDEKLEILILLDYVVNGLGAYVYLKYLKMFFWKWKFFYVFKWLKNYDIIMKNDFDEIFVFFF